MADESTAEIRELIDRHRIHDVAMRYCRACDRCDEELLTTVFHHDAYINYGIFNGLAPDFIRFVIGYIRTHQRGFHAICNELVTVDGNVAHAELYAIIQNYAFDDKGDLIASSLGGRYLDRYEKREGVWRISKRQFVLDWNEIGVTTSKWDSAGVAALAIGKMGKDDVSYDFWSGRR